MPVLLPPVALFHRRVHIIKDVQSVWTAGTPRPVLCLGGSQTPAPPPSSVSHVWGSAPVRRVVCAGTSGLPSASAWISPGSVSWHPLPHLLAAFWPHPQSLMIRSLLGCHAQPLHVVSPAGSHCFGLDGSHGFSLTTVAFSGVWSFQTVTMFCRGSLSWCWQAFLKRPCVMSRKGPYGLCSRVWIKHVMFGTGTQSTSAPFLLNSGDSGRPGALSNIRRTLKGSP